MNEQTYNPGQFVIALLAIAACYLFAAHIDSIF